MSDANPKDSREPLPLFPNGEYQIDGILGTGGMAVVYRARDLRRPRTVAIKILRPAVAQSIGVERFLREIAVASGFSHPHILPLLDSGETIDEQGKSNLYYVMPLVDGESLADRLERETRLPLADALRLTREILDALRYAHRHGVVHRDIKPANILLSGGHAVVADFGVARPVRGHASVGGHAPSITESGIIIGTPTYMSPEQALGDEGVDARSDVYAVGCVMYEMLTGDPPFDGGTSQSLVTRKISGVFLPATALRSGVPPDIDAVLSIALRPEASDRYASADAFLNALEGIEHRTASSPAPSRRPRLPRRMLLAAALVLAIAAVAVGTLAVRRQAADATPPLAEYRTRVAVLPFESMLPDSTLALVANALTVDIIDELAQYPALTVISRNGVMAFRAGAARIDSVAKVLNVGSIVTGDIRRNADSVQVVVRLIDGVTGTQLASAGATGAWRDVLTLRSTIIDSVTSFVRRQIGAELEANEHSEASSAAAWELYARAKQVAENDAPRWADLPFAEREGRFAAVDTLLLRTIALDPQWDAPRVYRASIRLQQANMEELAGLFNAQAAPARLASATKLRREAGELANAVLAGQPDNTLALYERGRAALQLWRTAAPAAPDSLRAAAESDLRAVVARRRDMADAWNDLSILLNMTGAYEQSRVAAENALKADAFLQSAPTVMSRLFFTSLASGRTAEARTWCARGQAQYPGNPLFWMCDLTQLGWTGRSAADVESAWRALQASEARDTNNVLASGWGTRRLLVAAVAARAGLGDSAHAIVRQVRASQRRVPADAVDYGEAHVHALLGHSAEAITLLERYLRANPALKGQVRHSPWFAALRNDARFVAITEPR